MVMSTTSHRSLWLIIGVLLSLILVFILYSSRTSYFASCTSRNFCEEDDHVSAEEAKSDSSNHWINSSGQQMVRRPTRKDCFPTPDQSIHNAYPEVCLFVNTSGGKSYYKKQAGFDLDYDKVGGSDPQVFGEDCSSTALGQGIPMSTGEFNVETGNS
jgi:hypothetical protein